MHGTSRAIAGAFCLACVITIRCFAQGSPTTANTKAAVPDAAALQGARQLVNDLYKAALAKARKPDEKAGLARTLLQTAAETTNDLAGKYVLLDMAKEMAVDAGAVDVAWSAVEQTAACYQVDGLKLSIDTFAKLATSSRTVDECRDLVARGDRMIDNALAQDRYALARQAAELVGTLAKQSRDPELTKSASTRIDAIKEIETAFGQVQQQIAALAQGINDPAANVAAGRFYCLVKGDWTKGLPMLAAGSDVKLKAVAEKELAKPAEAEKQVEVADGWCDLAENEKGTSQQRMREHAIRWYRQALRGLGGLAKKKVLNKLESMSGPTPNGLTLDLGSDVTMDFVRIAAGKFTMGSAEEKRLAQHEVTITKPFYMGIYEVTQAQWKAVTGTSFAEHRNKTIHMTEQYGEGDEYPMYYVSWADAMDFCKKASQKTGKTVRLPTEAEWEYACRAGTKTRFSFGDDEVGMGDHVWYAANSKSSTHPVGHKKPNAWGLYDMHGNVREWCFDAYKEDISREMRDPKVPGTATSSRVLRGDSWGGVPMSLRCAERDHREPDTRVLGNGFRVCLESR